MAGTNPADINQALHRQHSRLRDGGSLLEGHSGRFVREVRGRHTGIFGKRAETAHARIAVDLITRLERFDLSAHGFNTSSDITAKDMHARREETIEHAIYRRAPQQPPVPIVDGRRQHTDQDLIGFGRGLCHVSQFQDVGRPVAVHHNCFHACVQNAPSVSDIAPTCVYV